MLEWCLNQALCTLCAWRGELCEFDRPSAGSQHDTSWQAACIATEQGWDEGWVRGQLGEVQKARVSEEGGAGRPVGKVGPLRGGQREGALAAVDKGKQRASSLSEAGPSKTPWGHKSMLGPLGPHLYSPTLGAPLEQASSSPEPLPSITGFPMLAGGGFDDSIDSVRGGAPMGKGGSGHSTEGEGGTAVGVGHLGARGDGVGMGGVGFAGVSDAVGGMTHRGGGEVASGVRGLGVGALSSPGQCLHGTGVDPRWVDADVHESPSRASAGDGEDGEVASRASAAQHGGPRVMVGGGGGCGGGLAGVGGGSSGGVSPNGD
ncbi:hypothetical protein E4T56_gene18234 [Termitomyces sp. T112]|nr:hypothetical protein E4T56_gene18234 [Termitomyces sp. T112]